MYDIIRDILLLDLCYYMEMLADASNIRVPKEQRSKGLMIERCKGIFGQKIMQKYKGPRIYVQ